MKNVMVRAWEIAKGAVVKFGGTVKQYFALALTQAWTEVKSTPVTLQQIAARFANLSNVWYEYTQANAWEKHGFKRIYFKINGIKANVSFNDDLTQIVGSFVDSSYAIKEIEEVKALASLFNKGEIKL